MGNNQFAQLLKYYMMLNNKQQVDLVNDLGYDKSTVSGWCSGSRVPKLDVIIDIADYLNVNVGDLIVDKSSDDTNEKYYFNDDARELAQFMYSNPEYKVLFDATRNVKKEDIDFVKKMLDKFRE